MKTQKTFLALALATAASVSFTVHAQIPGPKDRNTTSVQEILAQPKDDQDVVLQGRLLRKLGDEKFLFSDGTGEITVEIDDDEMPRDPMDDNTTVELRGEVDVDKDRAPEIDVDSVRIMR